MKLAIFDLDHTLMPMDTGDSWVRFLVKRSGRDPKPVHDKLDEFTRTYRAGVIDIDEFERFQMQFLASFRRSDLNRYMAEFIKIRILPNVPEAARALVNRHREAGDMTALCTATYTFVSRAVADVFGIDAVMAAQAEEGPDGEFTGRMVGSHAYREGKVVKVREFIEKSRRDGIRFDGFAFYSDSFNDRPLFEFVASLGGECVAVNPDATLRTIAAERGWKSIDTYDSEALERAALSADN
ncbi:MAG TPA: HAD-IB family hydrolase [Sutterella sp.]|nr:HAD-IB family hydrolase [Sutterella sp.]